MLFSPYCREFNSLQKDIQHFCIGPILFSENKIIRSVVGGKVDGQNLAGTRSEKPKILFGTKLQFQKILFGSQRVNNKSTLLKMLPSTEEYFLQHCRHAALATIIDKAAHINKPTITPSPEFGWSLPTARG